MSRVNLNHLLKNRFGRYRHINDKITPITTRLINKKLITNCNWFYASIEYYSCVSFLGDKYHGFSYASGARKIELHILNKNLYCLSNIELLINTKNETLNVHHANDYTTYIYFSKTTKYHCGITRTGRAGNDVTTTQSFITLAAAYNGHIIKTLTMNPRNGVFTLKRFLKYVKKLANQSC
jgi:hypothetical protein